MKINKPGSVIINPDRTIVVKDFEITITHGKFIDTKPDEMKNIIEAMREYVIHCFDDAINASRSECSESMLVSEDKAINTIYTPYGKFNSYEDYYAHIRRQKDENVIDKVCDYLRHNDFFMASGLSRCADHLEESKDQILK